MDSNVKIHIVKTRKGKIHKVVEEIYQREDITIPIIESVGMDIESNTVYILDADTFLKQIDLIENCPVLNNVIVLQSVLEDIKLKDNKVFESLKNLIELETHRNFQVFANEYMKLLHTEKLNTETWAQRNERAILKAVKYCFEQAKNNRKDLVFITNSFKAYEQAKNYGINSKTIVDFVQDHGEKHPDLLSYLGFTEQDSGMDEEKPAIFPQHLPLEEAVSKIKKGEIFEGKLNISRNSIDDGRINLIKYGIEIIINGKMNQNRAVHGDRIAVELLPESEWQKVKVADSEERETDMEAELVEKEEANLSMKKLLDRIKKEELTPTGKVVGNLVFEELKNVAVIKKVGRNFCGELKPREKKSDPKAEFEIREFAPVDPRYPAIFIKIRNNGGLDKKKIVVKADNWQAWSPLPRGHFVSCVGDIGDDITEGNVILMEHGVEYKAFSKAVYDCLPPEGENWKIPEEELLKRRDFRDICVCSIDPPGCKDIDDALHCRKLPNGNFECGVHIADVSHFVRPDAPIDLEAQNRCTTVYLVGRRTDMLPKLLTETLCSLKGGVERLTFSVVWEMTPDANIVNVEYTKGIIKSKAAMTYGDAQKFLNDPSDKSELAQSVRYLNSLARIIRQRRIEAGALTLASTQVKFTFDEETHSATDVSLYQLMETNYLVEEFMLLANVAVAEKIVYHFPSNSILRRHTSPKPKQIKEFGKLLETLGYKLDYSSSKNLADSLDVIQREGHPFFNKLVRIMTTRTMNEAVYFCTSDADYPEFYHYGLAASCYTHFTSPIRRYADVLVHRLLAAAIDVESLPKTMCNKQKLNKMCDQMNMRNRNARNAGRASSDYNTFLFFKGKHPEERSMISSVSLNGFSVILEKYGLEGFIELDESDLKAHQARIKEATAKNPDYIVHDVIIKGTKLAVFDAVLVKIEVEMEHFHKKICVEYIRKL